MNLWEKVATTESGKFAHMIGALLYDHGCKIENFECSKTHGKENDTWHTWLSKLQHYLEKQAYVELKKEAEEKQSWVKALEGQLEKEAAS